MRIKLVYWKEYLNYQWERLRDLKPNQSLLNKLYFWGEGAWEGSMDSESQDLMMQILKVRGDMLRQTRRHPPDVVILRGPAVKVFEQAEQRWKLAWLGNRSVVQKLFQLEAPSCPFRERFKIITVGGPIFSRSTTIPAIEAIKFGDNLKLVDVPSEDGGIPEVELKLTPEPGKDIVITQDYPATSEEQAPIPPK